MGEITDKAQSLANKAMAKVLSAIKNVEEIERMACKANDLDAMKATNAVLIALRQAKGEGMAASGRFDVQIKGGST